MLSTPATEVKTEGDSRSLTAERPRSAKRGSVTLRGLVTRCAVVSGISVRVAFVSGGKHDDQVDALGLIGQLLDTIRPGSELPKAEEGRADARGADGR